MKGIIFPPRLVSPLPPQCVSGGVVKYTIYIPDFLKRSNFQNIFSSIMVSL